MTSTWRRKGGLASWAYDLRDGPEDVQRWLRETTLAVVELLDGFATPTTVWLTTESKGDLDEPVTLPESDAVAALGEALARYEDLVALHFSLALLLTLEPEGPEQLLQQAARLALDWDRYEDGGIYLHVFLSLDVDVYAERTLGEEDDNRALAAVNGPRLTTFLRGLRRLAGPPTDIYATWPQYEVNADGFGRAPA